MGNQIQVYVKKEKNITGQYNTGPVSDGITDHWCLARTITEYETMMLEADRLALNVVNQFASERDVQVKVYDVSTFKGKLMARLRGINKTPVIIVGNEKIEDASSELLKRKLESWFGKLYQDSN